MEVGNALDTYAKSSHQRRSQSLVKGKQCPVFLKACFLYDACTPGSKVPYEERFQASCSYL